MCKEWIRSLVVIASLGLLGMLGGCTTNPATGKTILTGFMTRNDEVRLGAEAAPQFTAEFGGAVESPALASYVSGIGERMAKETEADFPGLPWEFTLLDSPVVNAFALPGGKVFFSRGLAEKLTNEAEMAGVIGHEIGHVTAQHGAQRISQSGLVNILAAGAAVAVGVAGEDTALNRYGQYGVPALAIGGNLVVLKYGRDQELEADRLGLRYMSKVGYDPKGQLQVMELLRSLSQGGGTPAILSTHPDPGARVAQIEELLKTEYAATQNNKQYQLYAERYQTKFLAVIKKLPPPPAPKETGGLDLRTPESWCLTCQHDREIQDGRSLARGDALSPRSSDAEESGPVAPREVAYALIGPAPAQ